MSKSTATPAPQAFEPEFIAGLKSIFEEKIVFNQVLGLKITSLAPDGVVGRIDMKPDLVGHYAYNRIHGGVLDMIWRTARGTGLDGPRQSDIPNAGLNRVRVSGEAVEVLDWADVRHLADLPEQPVYDQTKLVVR